VNLWEGQTHCKKCRVLYPYKTQGPCSSHGVIVKVPYSSLLLRAHELQRLDALVCDNGVHASVCGSSLRPRISEGE